MERELITLHEANGLMLIVLILAPVAGYLWGRMAHQIRLGLTLGLLVGIGNEALWWIYNTITNQLGLDTVKNWLVNLAFFAFAGIGTGFAAARFAGRAGKEKS